MLRAQKNIMNCPCCPNDISDFLQNPQVRIEIIILCGSKLEQKKHFYLTGNGMSDAKFANASF